MLLMILLNIYDVKFSLSYFDSSAAAGLLYLSLSIYLWKALL